MLLLAPLNLCAATWEVCDHCQFRTLHEAVAHASPHDRLAVHEGTYAEGLVLIDKPLHLMGIDHPIIDGNHQQHVFYVRADDVTIEGFIIQNSGMSYVSELAGIRIEESKNCQILNNTFRGNTYSVYLAKVDTCTIKENSMTGNAQDEVSGGNGIHLWYSQHITVQHNDLSHHRDGLYFEFTPDSLVEDNISHDNIRYGLHFMFSSSNRYLRNIFSHNQTGVAVMYSKNVEMTGNHFEKSWGRTSYGLLLKDISDSLIQQNEFIGNTIGIFSDESNRDTFLHNNFKHNGWAVNILGSSDNNNFTENNFISNYFNVATNSQASLNIFEKNYWSPYQGYDLNHDGLGDTAFRPMDIFSLWLSQYPELVALLGSPVIQFLEVAEKAFPVLTPKTLEDKTPSMKPFATIQ